MYRAETSSARVGNKLLRVTENMGKESFKAYGTVEQRNSSQRKLTPRQMKVAENIKYHWHRKQAATPGLTQADACKELHWTHSVLGQYINGRVPAGPKAIFKLAEYFSVTPYDLDPGLKNEFAQAPEVDDLRATLAKMDAGDALKVINLLARQLPQQELIAAIEALAGVAADRVARS